MGTEILGKKIKFSKEGGEEYQIAGGNFIHPLKRERGIDDLKKIGMEEYQVLGNYIHPCATVPLKTISNGA